MYKTYRIFFFILYPIEWMWLEIHWAHSSVGLNKACITCQKEILESVNSPCTHRPCHYAVKPLTTQLHSQHATSPLGKADQHPNSGMPPCVQAESAHPSPDLLMPYLKWDSAGAWKQQIPSQDLNPVQGSI